ncbi:hypothetical protein KIN20_003417 [Parelaphostrongylus tenuis]|uniref:Uncharacterized protein n=1 Tax=Parelaphostrongylus tenuis TaxID=148309 RepID=A0AAD5M053_PARTN|nr:hypothetical protein KIN20_003417 [Parelaphostrongylus tenuis]
MEVERFLPVITTTRRTQHLAGLRRSIFEVYPIFVIHKSMQLQDNTMDGSHKKKVRRQMGERTVEWTLREYIRPSRTTTHTLGERVR